MIIFSYRVAEIVQKGVGTISSNNNNNLQITKSHWNKYLTKLVAFLLNLLLIRLSILLPKITILTKQQLLEIPEAEIAKIAEIIIEKSQIKLIMYQRTNWYLATLQITIRLSRSLPKKSVLLLLPMQGLVPAKTSLKKPTLTNSSSLKRVVEVIKTKEEIQIGKIRAKVVVMGEISVKSSNNLLCQVRNIFKIITARFSILLFQTLHTVSFDEFLSSLLVNYLHGVFWHRLSKKQV